MLTKTLFNQKNIFCLLIALMMSVVTLNLINTNTARAISPPLDPGCYNNNSGNFVRTDCGSYTGSGCYLVATNNGRQGTSVNREIDCDTGRLPTTNNSGSLPSAPATNEERRDLAIEDSSSEIEKYVNDALEIIYGVAAFAIIGTIIVGGIKYSMAGGSPQKTADAKKMIQSAILALVFLIIMFPILQWLVPGGIF